MVLILLVGPNLISQDLRYNALPLYFSRPLRRFDYCLGKLGVIVALLAAVIVVPSIAAYILGMAFSLDLSILRDTIRILVASIAYGVLIAVSAGMLMLAFSSLSRNSRYVALLWVGAWIVSSAVSAALSEADRENRRHATRESGVATTENELAASRHDWRPLVSYTANLHRIGEHLLDTRAAWDRLSKLQPVGQRDEFLLMFAGPQFPWYWSAVVLAALFGLSVCTLKFTIKSLDRLK
jgi:ABC-2 type transport system permease protein